MRHRSQQHWAWSEEGSSNRLQRCRFGTLLPAALLAGSLSLTALGVPAQAQSAAQEGEKLYRQYCVSCHTLGGGRLVGPDLKGITERRKDDWLVRFITEPETVRKDDPIAIANVKEFGMPMPRLGLNERQVSAILDYLKGPQTAPAGVPSQYVPTLALGILTAIGLTLLGLIAGTKKIDGGMS